MPRINHRQLLKAIVSIALLAYCLTLVSFDKVIEAIAITDKTFLFFAFLLTFAGTVACKALVTWQILSKQSEIRVHQLLLIHLTLRFYTIVLPKPVVAAIRWKKYSGLISGQLSAVLVTFEALLALLTASIMTLLFMHLDDSLIVPETIKNFVSILLGSFAFIAYILFIYPNSILLDWLEHTLLRWRLTRFAANLLIKWRDAAGKLHLSNVSIFFPVAIFSITGHLLFLLGAFLLFHSLHMDVDFIVMAWIRSVVFILVSVPVSIAGIGMREVSFVYFFGLYGLPADGVLAYAFLALLVQIKIGLIGMVIELKNRLHHTNILHHDT